METEENKHPFNALLQHVMTQVSCSAHMLCMLPVMVYAFGLAVMYLSLHPHINLSAEPLSVFFNTC